MVGKVAIAEIKHAPLCHREKHNEVVKWCNKPWEVNMPDDRFGEAVVRESDQKITIDLSQLVTLDVIACVDGVQKTYRLLGFSVSDEE